MIHRLKKITDGLYRGSAPSPEDLLFLKYKLGINKIVSLDELSGKKIDRAAKLLGIKHIMDPINYDSKASLLNFFKHNLKKLLLDNGPTFIHCCAGKDRTGLVSAIFECKYMGVKPEDAIKEAKSLGFGIGIDPKITKLYEKLINLCKPEKDVNNADIVSETRDYISDNRGGVLDEAHQGSFSPYLSPTRMYPYDAVYKDVDSQSPTRENYKQLTKEDLDNMKEDEAVPAVGVYNNDAGVAGFGPTLNMSGFIYD